MPGFRGASCALIALLLLAIAPCAHGVQIYSESFNYTLNSNLKDLPDWDEPGDPINDTVLDKIAQPNLSYPGMTPQGFAVQTGGKFSFDSWVGGNDNDPNAVLGGNGNTFWFGFLLQQKTAGTGGVDNPDYGGMLFGNQNAGPTNKVFVGKPGSGSNYVLENERGDLDSQHDSGVPAVIGTTALLVMKITFHGTDLVNNAPEDVSLYVNPSVTTPEESLVPNATGQFELFAFNDWFISTGTNATWLIDDIRIGTSYVDAVPEPAAMGIFGGVVIALLSRRRRTA